MSKKDQLHKFGINVIDIKDNNDAVDKSLVENMLQKIRSPDFMVMNLNKDIAQKCALRGREVEGQSIEEVKISSNLPVKETNCVFLGGKDSDSDDFIKKVFEKTEEGEESFLDSLKCNRIEYYPGALETLSDIDNKDVNFLNQGACNLQIKEHFNEEENI